MNNDELIAAGHELAKCLDSNTPLLDIAKMIVRLADKLDVTTLALREKTKQCDALAAENAALKAGASYFSYGSEHYFEWHKTAAEAVEAAEAAIDDYRGDACDGWSEEVTSVCWGVIMQTATKVGERPRTEDDCVDPAIDTICDYALLPNIETPATDAFLREVRAQGVEEFVKRLRDSADIYDKNGRHEWADHNRVVADDGNVFAAEMRQGGAA
ncbi:hypothetical protein [Cronobacter malonaticus]|uniref:hypothetical protein n=1 Tax=Cronobacter malonaticus TaxID=413503 RepID=UPI001F3158D2|nr:hypothetical protein [Cronobacter malonaticus]